MASSTSTAVDKPARRRGRPRKNPIEVNPTQTPSKTPNANDRPTPEPTPEPSPEPSRINIDESGQTLFEAIKDQNSALETIVSDWIEAFETDSQTALLTLINFIIKSSGCPNAIDREEFQDEDDIVDNIKNLQDTFEKESILDYPLISKSKDFKKFRKNLVEFFHRLVKQIKHSALYEESFSNTITSWVMAMSSSVFRPFRHTATTISHAIVSSICDAAEEVNSQWEVATNQMNTEQKKGRQARNSKLQGRLTSLEAKISELEEKKTKLQALLNEFFDCVFVHRYRDVEAIIRAESIKELGIWIVKYRELFLDNTYLRYIGWQLSDKSPLVRAEAVKSLCRIYAIEGIESNLLNFSQRFKSRILEMAFMESDINVRIPSINLLAQISGIGLLDDSDGYEDQLSLLIFSDNTKVRKAVAPFVSNILDAVTSRKIDEIQSSTSGSGTKRKRSNAANVTDTSKDINREWVNFKCLAEFLVKRIKAIKPGGNLDDDDELQMDIDSVVEDNEETDVDVTIAQRIGGGKKNRIGMAVEDLWNEFKTVKDWKTLAEYLAKDHSLTSNPTTTNTRSSSRTAGSSASVTDVIEEHYRLSEQEETILVEVFVTSLNLSIAEPTKARDKKDVEKRQADVRAEISRTMVKILPRLLTKYAPDAGRIVEVLQIPLLMNMDIYQDLRMSKAFETLVDDIKELFLKHTHSLVLAHAAETLRHMAEFESSAGVTETKIGELQEENIKIFRSECQDKELATVSLNSDQVHSLGGSLTRLEQLISVVNIVQAVEETDENNRDVVTCITAIAQRGMLARQDEEKIVLSAVNFLWSYIMWKVKGLAPNEDEPQDPPLEEVNSFMRKRDKIVDILSSLVAFGRGLTNVRKIAFKTLGNIYWLFSSDIVYAPGCANIAKLRLSCPSSMQAKFAAFVESEVKKLKQNIDEIVKRAEDESENEKSDDENEPVGNKSKKPIDRDLILTAEQKYEFLEIIGTILRGTRGGFFDIKLSASVIAQFGKFGSDVDEVIKKIVHEFKEQKLGADPHTFCEICSESLEKSFGLYEEEAIKESEEKEDAFSIVMESTTSLARLFANALHLRDTQTNFRRKDADHIVEIHTRGIEHALALIAGYQVTNQEKAVYYWAKYFKPLSALLGGISVNDVLTIDAKLREMLEANHIQVPDFDKEWEAYYTYSQKVNKLLVKFGVKSPEIINAESSRKPTGSRPRKKRRSTKKISKENITNDDSEDQEQEDRDDHVNDMESPTSPDIPTRRGDSHRRRVSTETRDSNESVENTSKRAAPVDDLETTRAPRKKRKPSTRKKAKGPEVSTRKQKKSPEIIEEEKEEEEEEEQPGNDDVQENDGSDSAESFQSLSDVRITRSGRKSKRLQRR